MPRRGRRSRFRTPWANGLDYREAFRPSAAARAADSDLCEVFVGSVIKKRRKRMAKKKHRKLLRKTRHQRRNKK
jgi:hypothetical protein